jgi:hypothetical protein
LDRRPTLGGTVMSLAQGFKDYVSR